MTLTEYKMLRYSRPSIHTLQDLADAYRISRTSVIISLGVRMPWKVYALRVMNAKKIMDNTPIPPITRYY